MKRRSAFHNSGAPTQAYVSPTTRVFGQPSGIVPVAPSVLNSPRHLPPTTRKARYTLRKARYTLRKARYTLRKARYTLAILPSAASRQRHWNIQSPYAPSPYRGLLQQPVSAMRRRTRFAPVPPISSRRRTADTEIGKASRRERVLISVCA